ncbi:unnamed protein product, partial [Vitis vinifera]
MHVNIYMSERPDFNGASHLAISISPPIPESKRRRMSSHPLSFTPLRRIPTNTLPLPPPPPPSPTSNLHRTPSSRTYIPSHVYKHPSAILLELCTSMKELHQFIPLIIKNGLYSEHLFQTKLVSLFCKFGSLHEAARVFQPIEDKIDELYHTMLKGYARNSSLDDAVSFFCRMRYDGVRPVVYNFTYLLKVCGDNADLRKGKEIHCQLIVNGFASNVFAMTGVVNMYAKCRLVEEAYKMFDRMPERDLVCWNTIISGYAQNGFGKTALELVLRMQEEGKRPDSITIVSILPAVADVGSLRIGRSIHGYSMRAGFESFVNVSTALVDMYSKCGSVGTARLIFDRMTAMEIFQKMMDEQVEMTNVTVMGALHACADLGDVEQGRFVHKLLDQLELGSDVSVMNSLISMYSKCKRLFDMMDERHVTTWNAMIDGYGTHGLGKAALELFEKMKKEVIKPNEVTFLCKTPGWSVVELQNEVHTFYSGTTSHPQAKKIYAFLETLGNRIKAAGYMPDTNSVHDVEDVVKEQLLNSHSEKLAIAFSLLNTSPGTTIHLRKNLRVCGDCHNATKYISLVTKREIIVRDMRRFHHFKDGTCSCGDYW